MNEEEYLFQIVRLFNDPGNTALQNEIAGLRAQSPAHEEFYQQVRKLWTTSAELKGIDSIHVAEATERLSVKLKQTARYRERQTRTVPLLTWTLRAAAVLLVGMAGYWWFADRDNTTYLVKITEAGVTDSVRLADGTTIYLDEHTTLRYPATLAADLRWVDLERGNAFFAVARDEAHPFVVRLGGSSVTVLGTSFNITTTPSEIRVNVKTGKVKFQEPEGGAAILNAGHGVVYTHATNTLTRVDATNRNADAWLTHTLHFEDASLPEVLQSLEQYYKTQFTVADSIVNFQKFNATFRNNELKEVLEVLEATYPIKVEQHNNHVVIRSVH